MVTRRQSQYLITTRPILGMHPMAVDELQQALQNMPDVKVVKTLAPRGFAAVLAEGVGGPSKIIVAQMPDERANSLRQSAPPGMIIERDHPLRYLVPDGIFGVQSAGTNGVAARVFTPVEEAFEQAFSVKISVVGPDEAPVPNAIVYVYGSGFPAQGTTGATGEVTLQVVGGTLSTVRALYVKPAADYWDAYIREPELRSDGANSVVLTPLRQTFPNFPDEQMMGWGQRAMNLDKVPPQFTGRGVKVGIIDSGAVITHPDLDQIANGFDVVNNDPNTWREDVVFHGSHCAGIIAGNAANNFGIRGFAPEAEVYVYKVFPGGAVSDIISALHDCVEKQIDVVNLSLGSDQPSQILEQEILRAKNLGIACIAAAGNTGGPLEYPATSPNVLAVAAIGKLNEFPNDTYHAQTVLDPRLVTSEGFFAPNFSCHGPQVAVCAPGVAVISSVPPRNFAAWDGTSMAAPHVTGLAALILAHHPSFQGPFRQRNAQRVEQLFQIIRMSARPVHLGDPTRTGFGLPDAQRALPVFAGGGVPLTTMDGLLQYVGSLLSGTQPQPTAPFATGAAEGGTRLPTTQEARDYLVEEMRKRLQDANLA